jgi:hypothetical protein
VQPGQDGGILVATEGLMDSQRRRPAETVAELGNGSRPGFPADSAGSRRSCFPPCLAANADASSIEVMTLADRHRKTVSQAAHPPVYAHVEWEGHLVYVNKTTLFAVLFDLGKLETRGTALPIVEDVAFNHRGTLLNLRSPVCGTLV